MGKKNPSGDGASVDSVENPVDADEKGILTNSRASDDSGVPVTVNSYMEDLIVDLIKKGILVKKKICHNDCVIPTDSVIELSSEELSFDFVEKEVVFKEFFYATQDIPLNKSAVKIAASGELFTPPGGAPNRRPVITEDEKSFADNNCEITISSQDDINGNVGNNFCGCTVSAWMGVFSIVAPLVAGIIIVGSFWKNIF